MDFRLILAGGNSIEVKSLKGNNNAGHDELLKALEINSVWIPTQCKASFNGTQVDWVNMKNVIAIKVMTGGNNE